jgi:hypothetical protein
MSQEGTRAEAELAASMAEGFHQLARHLRDFSRTMAIMGAALEAYRGTIQAAMEAQEARRIAEARELANAVAAPPAKRQRTAPLPDYMQPSALPMEAMVPWPTFWRDLEITPLEAVAMIREEMPGALRPDPEEAATWPSDDDPAERQYAATKLTGFTGPRAVAAQDALLQLWRKRRRQ